MGHIYGKDENSDSKRCMHPIVHSSTITVVKTWKQLNCSLTDEWIKLIYIHTYTHIPLHMCIYICIYTYIMNLSY